MKEKAWQGRIDGNETNQLRWHQIVQYPEGVNDFNNQFVLLGFESDEGVSRNKGRIGAQNAPNEIRSCMSSFPAHDLKVIYDLGNIRCENHQLEQAQNALNHQLKELYQKNGRSLVMGGGHEITFPHYKALYECFPEKKIGVINFDAHFDNRPLDQNIGASSGTGFSQIAELQNIHSLHVGIQKNSNTKALFEYADQQGMQYIFASDFYLKPESTDSIIADFIDSIEILYLTICMDVFSSAFAPGVSATAYNGMIPDAYFVDKLKQIIGNSKLMAFDVAEVNPLYDIDRRTAKLAASFIFEVMQLNV